MRSLVDALTLSAALMLPTTASMPGSNGGSDPEDERGPIVNYDRRAIREAEATRRRAKHAEKMARRAAQRGK